jgi:hypothetical protein
MANGAWRVRFLWTETRAHQRRRDDPSEGVVSSIGDCQGRLERLGAHFIEPVRRLVYLT